ncbi:transposable element Tc3 transposase [Trichonephila clavipes]|nr:transposable element Tc3 transposase [Trichonephila clavipes]
MHVNYVEAQSSSLGVVWKFGQGLPAQVSKLEMGGSNMDKPGQEKLIRAVINSGSQVSENVMTHRKESPFRNETEIRMLHFGSETNPKQHGIFLVETTSGCFYPRSNHWEVGGRPQCDKCGCRVRNCSQHRFTTLETISNYRNSYPGGSVVVVHEEPHPQMTGTLSYRPEETGGRQREKSLDTRHRRLTTDIAFYRGQKTALWWSVCTTPYENRFSLSSDSHHTSNIIERDRFGGRGVLVWGGIMLGSRIDLHIFDAGSVNGTRYCNEILLPYVRLFRGTMCLQFLFMDDNAPCHRTVAAKQHLESEDIERMDWPARSPDLNTIEHVWDFLGRRLAARTLPPVTIRELRLALQDEWEQCLNNSLIPSFSAWADTVKPA